MLVARVSLSPRAPVGCLARILACLFLLSQYMSLKSLNSLESLPKTMRCDECSGPGGISLSQRWDRWLAIVEPQIKAGALVQRMEDMIQGDLRLVIARQ